MEENFKTQVFEQCEKLYEGAMLEAEGYNGHNDNEITEGLSIQKDAYANIIDLISEYHEKTSDKLLTQEEFKEQIEHFFIPIIVRETKKYQLSLIEIDQRINEMKSKTVELADANEKIKTLSFDYRDLSFEEQKTLSECTWLLEYATKLLTEPIKKLAPNYTKNDFNDFCAAYGENSNYTQIFHYHMTTLVSLANLLYKIDFSTFDKDWLCKLLTENKNLLISSYEAENTITSKHIDLTEIILNYKYLSGN